MSKDLELFLFRKCKHCGGEVREVSFGDEGLSVCTDCESVEGGDTEVWVDHDGNEVPEDKITDKHILKVYK